MNRKNIIIGLACTSMLLACGNKKTVVQDEKNTEYDRASATLDSIYKYYGVENSVLLRETFPFDDSHKATYLASDPTDNTPNQYSYLWPYSGIFSSANVLFEASEDKKYRDLLDSKVIPGLDKYYDNKRIPAAYASYINTAPQSDRFYDDNVWLGIDFTDIYTLTNDSAYLKKAAEIWTFIESGIDSKLGGGIYWCEQKKESKNTCSNAPGAVFALKLFKATNDNHYYDQGKELYAWTKANLQDTADNLYYDNINLAGKVSKEKYAYNSGQMLQASVLLYDLTKDQAYLTDAQKLAQSCYNYFFEDYLSPENESFRILKKTDVWFIAVMMRGFVELYQVDKNKTYIDAFAKNLDHAWKYMRDEKGLFSTDWTGKTKDDKKWLLTQAAMVEMYARIATIK